ncbi:hypothetical protein BH24ACT7_BH24ACT7_11030 [soil metagenome]
MRPTWWAEVFGNREGMVKIFVWLVVVMMVLTLMASLFAR